MPSNRVPACRKCSRNHYNFQPCPTPETEGNMRAAVVVRQPREQRDWKTRSRTVRLEHGNVLQPRQYTASGRVTSPDGKPLEAPRLPKLKPSLVYPTPREVKKHG